MKKVNHSQWDWFWQWIHMGLICKLLLITFLAGRKFFVLSRISNFVWIMLQDLRSRENTKQFRNSWKLFRLPINLVILITWSSLVISLSPGNHKLTCSFIYYFLLTIAERKILPSPNPCQSWTLLFNNKKLCEKPSRKTKPSSPQKFWTPLSIENPYMANSSPFISFFAPKAGEKKLFLHI